MSTRQLLFGIAATSTACNALLAGVLWSFYRRYRRQYLRYWTWSWVAFFILGLSSVAMWHPGWTLSPTASLILGSTWTATGYWQAVFLLAGTFIVATGRVPSTRLLCGSLTGLTLLAVGLPLVAWQLPPYASFMLREGHTYVAVSAAFLIAGWALLRPGARRSGVGRSAVGMAFLGFGALRAYYQWLVFTSAEAPRDQLARLFVALGLVELTVIIALGIAMVIWLLEEEQDAASRGAALAAMGSLAQGVAHEVRHPLFALSATVDALAARHGADTRVQKVVGRLQLALDRLLGLAADLEDYGSPLSKQLLPTAVPPIVEEAVAACSDLARAEGKRVVTSAMDDLPRVSADRSRLGHAFRNLVDNALRHSPAGGEVRVSSAAAPGSRLMVTVSDDGPGFVGADLEMAFAPFFTRRREGRGLGLALVRRVVEQHGGEIVLRNRSHGGAEVVVRLPAA